MNGEYKQRYQQIISICQQSDLSVVCFDDVARLERTFDPLSSTHETWCGNLFWTGDHIEIIRPLDEQMQSERCGCLRSECMFFLEKMAA